MKEDAQRAGRTAGREGSGLCDLNPGTTAKGLEGRWLCVLGKAEGNPKGRRLGIRTQCSIWEERSITVMPISGRLARRTESMGRDLGSHAQSQRQLHRAKGRRWQTSPKVAQEKQTRTLTDRKKRGQVQGQRNKVRKS